MTAASLIEKIKTYFIRDKIINECDNCAFIQRCQNNCITLRLCVQKKMETWKKLLNINIKLIM